MAIKKKNAERWVHTIFTSTAAAAAAVNMQIGPDNSLAPTEFH